ncbi:hypothetical protein ACX9NE_16775 [Mycobacterium sp. ML4]
MLTTLHVIVLIGWQVSGQTMNVERIASTRSEVLYSEDPVGNELAYERVEAFSADGLRQVSRGPAQHLVACSSTGFRRRSSANSADSPVLPPGSAPSSMSA